MAPRTTRPALVALLLVLLSALPAEISAETTTAPTTEAPMVWVKMPSILKLSKQYEEWMTNSSTAEYQQLAEDAMIAVKPLLTAEFEDQHVVTEVVMFEESLGKTKIHLSTTVKTIHTDENDVPIKILEERLKDTLSVVRAVADSPVTGLNIKSEDFEFIAPFTTTPQQTDTTQPQTTVREKRSTTAVNETSTTIAEATTAATEAAATEAAATQAAATEAAVTQAAATEAAVTQAAATEAAVTQAAAANTTEAAAANATEAANTTTTSTTTEAPLPVSAMLECQITITNLKEEEYMGLPFTDQYQQLASKVEYYAKQVLLEKFGDDFLSVQVTGFNSDPVNVKLDVGVMTDKTRAEDVDGAALATQATTALQNLIDEGDFTFDPAAAQTSEVVKIVEPTTTPAPTEDPYQFTILRLSMRAPFVNWTDELNDTDSQAFADMQRNVNAGVDLMVSKKYPKENWNVSSSLIYMLNDTVDGGVFLTFFVTVEPQMTNTSAVIRELATNFFYFNTLGDVKITPTSVNFKDLTTYAPGRGVVIMDEDYLRELRKTQYNGSFVGDYTTQPPTLQPIIKRHDGFVKGIAVPAFIGMIAAIGLLLICTTIAGAKKSDD